MKLLEHMPVTAASQASTEKVLSEDVLEGGDRGREGGGRTEGRKKERERGRKGGKEGGKKEGREGAMGRRAVLSQSWMNPTPDVY